MAEAGIGNEIAGVPTSPGETRRTEGITAEKLNRWAMLALVIGASFRLLQYLGNRSLWLDEALLLAWFQERSIGEILTTAHLSAVPFGFLAAQRIATVLLGDSELVLRLIPLVAALAALWLYQSATVRLLPPAAATLAVGLYALSPFLIYYASEVKAYSIDVAATALFLLLGAQLLESEVGHRRVAIWAIAAFGAVALSVTSVFSIAAVGLTVILVRIRRRELAAAGRVAVASTPAATLCLFLLARRPAAESQVEVEGPGYMEAFWSSGFMPFPPQTAADWMWFPNTAMRVFQDPLGLMQNTNAGLGGLLALLTIAVAVAGAVHLAQHRPLTLILALGPIALALLASAARLYPFGADWNTGGRVILFLAPCFYLVIGAGIAPLLAAGRRQVRVAGLALAGMLLAPGLIQATATVPYGRGELKPLLTYAADAWRPGDRLYVHYDAVPAFRYYAPRFGFSPGDYIEGVCSRFRPERYLEALNELRGEPRVWILFAAGRGAQLYDERELMVSFLEHAGRRVDDRVARGTFLYLYDMRTPPVESTGFSVRLPAIRERVEEGCQLWS